MLGRIWFGKLEAPIERKVNIRLIPTDVACEHAPKLQSTEACISRTTIPDNWVAAYNAVVSELYEKTLQVAQRRRYSTYIGQPNSQSCVRCATRGSDALYNWRLGHGFRYVLAEDDILPQLTWP